MAALKGKDILFEKRIMLKVKKGTVGLRQSDAFFQHVQNLPLIYDALMDHIDPKMVKSVVVSNQPRNVLGSYMPVFTAGERFAEVIAKSLQVPLIKISHQENHLYAVLREFSFDDFIGLHISGGTSEILRVKNDRKLAIEILGGTLDLSFGKLIDRLGVYMGLDFPCGKYMDQYAQENDEFYKLKKSIKDNQFNISGVENKLKDYFDLDGNLVKVSRSLFEYIADVLVTILRTMPSLPILVSGGVAANSIIRQRLKDSFDCIYFCDSKYASDHSIGNAYYGSLYET